MFYGLFRHHVDAKGRVALPAQFRRELAQGCVIAIGPEGRLVIRSPEEWKALEERYRMTSETPAEERAYIRQLYSNARAVELDAQGRILLTPEQRAFAQIGDRVVFVGSGNIVELVGEPVWDGEMSTFSPATFTELGDSLNKRGPSGPATQPV
ncbi:MAG: division/cell wall cluster transcriptional repressor MraZ [Candidatus Dormibacteria bacterium]